MAKLFYKKYVNKNSESNAYGKIYARLVPMGTMETDDICDHIAEHGTIYTSDIVKGVIEKFVNCFEELLLQGYKLKLNGLGTFKLAVNTTGADDDEANPFTPAANIKSVRVRFLGDQGKRSDYATRVLTRKAAWQDIETFGKDSTSSGSGSSNSGGSTVVENP